MLAAEYCTYRFDPVFNMLCFVKKRYLLPVIIQRPEEFQLFVDRNVIIN